MSNIIHIINAMQIGGVEVGVLSLLKSKSDSNYRVMTVGGCDKKLYESLTTEEKSRLYVCNGYINSLLLLIKLKPNIVISSLWRAHFISVLYKLIKPGIKRVHFVHNAGYGHFVNNLVTRISVFMANTIFTDSSESKEWFKKEMRRRDAVVVPMNVSFSSISTNINFEHFTFVFVGRFCKQKNLKQSIDFIERLNSLGLNATFDLYGRDDGELDYLLSYVDSKGLSSVVTFHENILPTMIEEEMRKYNYYLQSSLAEGMAISVYQSIKNGLLAVINPVGEIRSYTKNSVNAFYLNLDNIDGSAEDFKKIIVEGNKESFNVGCIINKKNYPDFDVSFFLEVNKM